MFRLGTAILVFSLLGWLTASPASAVFPGSKGRLAILSQIFAPPDPTVQVSTGIGQLRYSPDGTMVAGMKPIGSAFNKYAIWVAKADGSEARQLTTPGPGNNDTDKDPSWSPDGRELLIEAEQGSASGTFFRLERVNVETGVRTPIGMLAKTRYRHPEWSPDGTRIVAGGRENHGSLNEWEGLFYVAPSTGAWTRIPGSQYMWAARFSPDGSKLAIGAPYYVYEDKYARVMVTDATSAERPIFEVATSSLNYTRALATFTPDGSAITWGDCKPTCGAWSKALPTAEVPDAPPTLEVERPFAPADEHMDWQPILDTPVITGGPAGSAKGSTATFTFEAPTTQPGRFECRLVELGTWATCTSPKTYSDLPDGPHTFEVRFVQTGDANPEDNTPTTRAWTSDGTAPVALLDQSPSGTVDASEATFVFRSSEPEGATFRCRLDGGAEVDCASPLRVTSLGEGDHSFGVRAIDAVGNEQIQPTQAAWTVRFASTGTGGTAGGTGGASGGGITAPKGPSAGCTVGQVKAGVITAMARGGCFTPKRDGDHDVFVTTGVITLNGVQITPARGTSIVIDPRLSDVSVEWTGPVTIGFGDISWTIPFAMTLPIGKANTSAKFLLPAFEKLQDKIKVAGLKVAVAPQFEMTDDDGGATKVGLKIALPSSFSGLKSDGDTDDGKVGGLNFEFAFTASNDKGTRFAVRGTVDRAYLWGKVKLTDVSIGLDSGPPLAFEAKAALTFNEEKLPAGISREKKFEAVLGFTKEQGQWPNLAKVGIAAAKFQKPLAYGFFLQRFGVEFNACGGTDGGAGTATTNAGISFGPSFKFFSFEGEAVSLDGKVFISLCKEPELKFTGEGKIVDVKVGDAGVEFPFEGLPKLTGNLNLSIGGYGYTGAIQDSWFALPQDKFNVQAKAEMRFPGLVGLLYNGAGEAVFSSVGWAACSGKPDRRIGMGKRWEGSLEVFADSCDVGPFKATATASAAQLPGAPAFSVKAGTKVAVVELRGTGGPPKGTLTGPAGRSIVVPDGPEGIQRPDAIVIQDAAAQVTRLVLFEPPSGTWTLTPSALGAPFAGLRVAEGLPPVDVKAASKRARGGRRTLSWKLTPRAGQDVSFVEIGSGTTRVLTTTRRRAGKVSYVPQPGPGGGRRVDAVVTQDGLPRATRTVARYVVPRVRLRRPGAARLRGRTVSWPKGRGVKQWSVLLRGADGRTLPLDARRPRVAIPSRWPRRGRVTVVLVPLGLDGSVGPRRVTTLRRR